MANPLYMVTNQDTATAQQGAAPQTPGAASPVSSQGLPLGLTPQALAVVAVIGIAAYAFWQGE